MNSTNTNDRAVGAITAAKPLKGPASGQAAIISSRPPGDAIPLATTIGQPAESDFGSGLPDVSLFPLATWRRHTSRALTMLRSRPAGSGCTG